MDSKLLSICVPTYNGAGRIIKTLGCAIEAIGNREDIEIIVSDNASTDDTYERLKEYTNTYSYVKVYRNEHNLGFNCNMIKLIDEYASGLYCWVIGNDDFLDPDSIHLLAPLLANGEADYISVNFRTLNEAQYENFELKKKREANYLKGSYFECLEKSASLGNILGTFMSAHIFRLSMVRKLDKTELKTDVWNTYKTIFPNSYLMLEAFSESNHCYYIKNSVFTALDWDKDYSSKWMKVVDEVLPKAYEYTIKKSNGRQSLKKNNLLLYDWGLRMNTIRLLQGDIKHTSLKYFISPKSFACLFYYLKDKFGIILKKNLL